MHAGASLRIELERKVTLGCYELDRQQDERRQELRWAVVQAPKGSAPIPGGADSGAE